MVDKDMEKAQRLNEVYKYVFAHFDIKSQKDFADYLDIQRTGLSAAMNGAKANLTKNLFTKICAAFPGVFDLHYLLTGEGSLLTVEEDLRNKDVDKMFNIQPSHQPEIPDYVKTLVETATQIISRSEEMNQQTASLIRELQQTKKKMETALESIEDMKSQLAMMTSMYSSPQTSDFFPTTVANDDPDDLHTFKFVTKKNGKQDLIAVIPQGLIRGDHPGVTDEIIKKAAELLNHPNRKK